MMASFRKVAAASAIAVLSLFLLSGVSMAADAKATGVLFGGVDMEAAFNASPKKKDNEAKFQAMVAQMQQKIDLHQKNRLLTAEEFKQLVDITTKPNPTPEEKAKADELLNLSKARDQELQALQQKKDATDADKARLKALQDQLAMSDQAIREEAAQYADEIEKAREALSNEVKVDIYNAVAAIAKEKGLSVVFNKTAGDLILVAYTQVDITDDVIKRLSK